MSKAIMNAIPSLLKALAEIDREMRELQHIEDDNRLKLAGAADADITTPAAKQVVADCRLGLELVHARRAKLRGPSSELQARLRREFKGEGQRWNAVVEKARLAKEKEMVCSLLPYWQNDEQTMCQTLGPTLHAATVFGQFRKAQFYFPSYQDPEEEGLALRRDVLALLKHIERHSEALGLS